MEWHNNAAALVCETKSNVFNQLASIDPLRQRAGVGEDKSERPSSLYTLEWHRNSDRRDLAVISRW
jgi:hypothetical protein